MATASFFVTLLLVFHIHQSLASSVPKGLGSADRKLSRARDDASCDGSKCRPGISFRLASRRCSFLGRGCKAFECETPRAGRGYTCSTGPTPSATPTPSAKPTPTSTSMPSPSASVTPSKSPPLQFSGIESLDDIVFPPDSIIGQEVELEVSVTVDITSGAPREDFYFLTDATGSMREEIEITKKQFSNFIASRRDSSGDVAYGVGYYKDDEDPDPFKNLQPITTESSSAESAISSLAAIGGGDPEEANLFALSQVAELDSIGWRKNSRKVLIYFGDAPGHEPTCPSPETRLTRQVVSQKLKTQEIAVVATDFGGLNGQTRSSSGKFKCGKELEIAPAGQADFIASGTQGSVTRASAGTDLIQQVIDSVESLDQTVTAVTTDCDGRVAITFSPDLPVAIAAGETKKIMEKAVLLPGACSFPDGFSCEIDLFLSGVGYRQVIQTTSIAC